MGYSVKEIFYTLQGEGAQAGRAAVFCRFAGCNLWSGREEDRAGAVCKFCDTDFVGTGPDGGKFATADELADRVAECWGGNDVTDPTLARNAREGGAPGDVKDSRDAGHARLREVQSEDRGQRFVVCTGGEPLLQINAALIDALHARGFEVAIETNGTIAAPAGIDWICVSPKAGAVLVQNTGDELKLVYPQAEMEAQPERFAGLGFRNFFLQPMDGAERVGNTERAIRYCMEHPRWRLSLQNHKLVGIR